MSVMQERDYYFDRKTFGFVYILSTEPMIIAQWVGWVSKDGEVYQRALQWSDKWPEERDSYIGRFFEPGPAEDFDIIEESEVEERLVPIDELRGLNCLPEEVCADIELHLLVRT